jgi:hypothetical protein
VKECVHIDTGRYYAAKVINKRLMAGREHMVFSPPYLFFLLNSTVHHGSYKDMYAMI